MKIHSTSFATNNALGKTAKEEGGGQGTLPASNGAAKQEAALGEAAGSGSLEETIVRRFAVWLGEILHAGA